MSPLSKRGLKDEVRTRDDTCVYCGGFTLHWTRTCVGHRYLVEIDTDRLYSDVLDAPRDYGVPSQR
jgi:hypothetical protein